MAADGRPVGDGLGAKLWRSAEHIAMESLHSPFVTALGQGTLPRSAFQHYTGQDAFFLQVFAKAYALALSKCDPAHTSQETFDELSKLLRGVHEELRLHDAYARGWGVDLHAVRASPATLAYTDFLMEVAHDSNTGLAEVLCAMAPCARLYAFLGRQLALAGCGGEGHPYAEWISTYDAESYHALPALKESMMEEAAAAQKSDHGRLLRLYTRAMQLEVDFFCAHPGIPPPRHVRSLVVDFDDTCTEADTIAVFLEAAAGLAEEAGGPAAAEAVRAQGKQLAASYAAKYTALMQRLLPEQQQAPAAAAYDAAGLAAFLDELSDFDAAMLTPVEQSGILKGLTAARLQATAAARGVALRPGCSDALQRALAMPGLRTHVLSVNWSPDLILATLALQPGRLTPGLPPSYLPPQNSSSTNTSSSPSAQSCLQLLMQPLEEPSGNGAGESGAAGGWGNGGGGGGLVVCNRLEADEGAAAVSTGRIAKAVTCARDKGAAFRSLVAAGRGGGAAGCSVYVGDSATDLAALLQADYGVVVGSSGSLRKVCARFGVRLRPLVTAPLDARAPPGVLYEASSWAEIEAFLFGPRSYEAHPYKARMDAVRASWGDLQRAAAQDGRAASATASAAAADAAAEALSDALAQPEAAAAAPAAQREGGKPAAAGAAARPGGGGGAGAPGAANGAAAAGVAGGGVGAGAPPHVPVVLTIAGSDSGGGAGVQADLKAMQACGVFGTSAVCALTAQNTRGVQRVHVPPAGDVEAQVDSVLADIGAHAVKTGMLPSPEVVQLVARKVRQYGVRQLVVDPVMVSTSGHELAGNDVARAMKQHLMPLALLVTPNVPEAQALLGDPGFEIRDEATMCEAAKRLHAELGCHAVLVKGGHLLALSPQQQQQQQQQQGGGGAVAGATVHVQAPALAAGGGGGAWPVVTDVLYDGRELHVLRAPAVACSNTHGTGCTLASAVASFLARGQPLLPAVMSARAYLHECLRHSTRLRIGQGVQRPFNHGWQLADWQQQHGQRWGLDAAQDSAAAALGTAAASEGPARASRWPPALVRRLMAVYVVTDSELNRKHQRSVDEAVAGAVAGGATIVQIREKTCDGGELLQRAAAALKVCRAAGVPLVVNDRVDVALALGPDVGVHVGQSDLPVAAVRALLGPGRLLGVSAHSPEEAARALADGADYIGVGAVYATSTKDTDVLGLEGLKRVCDSTPLPVVAIGGIKLQHVPDVLAAGAHGVAVVSGVFDAADVAAAARVLAEAVARAQQLRTQRSSAAVGTA